MGVRLLPRGDTRAEVPWALRGYTLFLSPASCSGSSHDPILAWVGGSVGPGLWADLNALMWSVPAGWLREQADFQGPLCPMASALMGATVAVATVAVTGPDSPVTTTCVVSVDRKSPPKGEGEGRWVSSSGCTQQDPWGYSQFSAQGSVLTGLGDQSPGAPACRVSTQALSRISRGAGVGV